jgi:hypothetical protein
MVVRLALQNAASMPGCCLSSESMIVDSPRDLVATPTTGGTGADALSIEPYLSGWDRRPARD